MTFKEKLVEFSTKNIWSPGEYWWGWIGLGFIINSIAFIAKIIFKPIKYGFGVITLIYINVCAIPVGWYMKWDLESFSIDSTPNQIESWPRIFGHNIWLWVAVPPAWVAHEYFHYSWITSILIGIICVPAVPIVWHMLTYKVTVTEKPEQ